MISSATAGMMASDAPRPWGQFPYPFPVATEAEYRSLGLEGEGRSWGGGRVAPWRSHELEERGGPQSPLSMEDRGFYGGSERTGRRRPWLPPKQEDGGSWRATSRGPQEPPREYQSSKKEGRRGSWEPPRKRARSPPVGGWLRVPLSPPREDSWESPEKRVQSPRMGEGWRAPLSPPRGRGSTSPDSQRQQPSAHATHATHWEPSFRRDSRRDSSSNGGSPWVSRGRKDGPETESRGRSWESPEPAWESCRDPGTSWPASQRAMEGRDSGMSRRPREPGSSVSISSTSSTSICYRSRGDPMERRDSVRSRRLGEPGGGSSSSSHHRNRGDPGWDSRHGNPVDGSYSVKAGGIRESWSGRGFQIQMDSRERDNRGQKGGPDEGWARDEGLSREDGGRSVGSPREIIPQKRPGAKESFRGDFLGPKGCPERYEGHGTQAATTGTFSPRLEVVNYWMRCHHLMWKKEREKFYSICPRPTIPDRSSIPPFLNPDLELLLGKHAKALSSGARFSLQTQWDVLNMLAPAMGVYEMAEAAMERKERVDPLAVRRLARCLLSFAGSTNRRLTLQHCSQVLRAIDPQLVSMMTQMNVQQSSGLLFAERSVHLLKKAIRRLGKVPEEPPEQNFDKRREERTPTLTASPPESAPLFQDGPASLAEKSSDQQVQPQDGASLELWHRRFGHADSAAILRLQNDNLATGIKVDPGEAESTARCRTCLGVKGDHPSFSLNTVSRSTALLDLIHCELFGPFKVPSLRLQRYVLLFVDDYSRFCVTFLLKETSKAHKCFKRYFAMLRKSHKSEPKAFQMNSAAGSILPQTLRFLEARGISHKRGVECIPGQSRTAEREMKSLLEMTRCMLADANLPSPFWGHAIRTATYLWNQLAVSRMKSTPFQAWSGKMPCVNNLRIFGSLVRDREDPNGQHVIIGYSFSLAKYTVMDLETGAVGSTGGPDIDEQQGVEKKGNFLVTLKKQGYDIELFTGTGVQGCGVGR